VQLTLCGCISWALFHSGFIGQIEVLTSGRPWLEMAAFSALALVPYIMARWNLIASGVEAIVDQMACVLLRVRGPHSCVAHLVLQAKQPFARVTQSMLYFVAVNLLANAVPASFEVDVPKMLRFLDANGDGTLEAEEIEGFVYQFTSKILSALLSTHLLQYVLAIKGPPADWTLQASKKRQCIKELGLLERYWQKTATPAGWWTLLDFLVAGSLWLGLVYTWLMALGVDATKVAALGGVGGIALGLAAQTVVGNGVAALIILATAPCKVGDSVEVGLPELRFKGVVREIGWNATAVKEPEGRVVYIPNGVMLDTPLVVLEEVNDDEGCEVTELDDPRDSIVDDVAS